MQAIFGVRKQLVSRSSYRTALYQSNKFPSRPLKCRLRRSVTANFRIHLHTTPDTMSDKSPVLRAPNVYVTGHLEDGRSIVLPSKPLHWSVGDHGNMSGADMFVTNESPIDFSHREAYHSPESTKLLSL